LKGVREMDTTKLRVKVGQHEFEAEGPVEQVTAQYTVWRELIAAQPKESAPPVRVPLSSSAAKPVIPADRVTEVRTRNGYTGPLDIFELDSGRDLMKLLVHPPAGDTRDADAILLVLYGYRKVGADGAGVARVPVTKLKQSLDISGLGIARVDRSAKSYVDSRYILKSGRSKGGVYELTVTGTTRAEELANRLFAELVG
jgi:hypothetical protein